jgi:phospholipid/cholesterol/gamma-HCH transport system permease protein
MMTINPALSNAVLAPLAWVGRKTLDGVGYLGALGSLLASAGRSIVRPAGDPPPFLPALMRQLSWMLAMGLPLVGLVHVALGSFLSMQAYFGGTFVDGTGAVVGVGLIRNAAPMMAGLTLAGLIGARTTAELRGRSRIGLDGDPGWVADREVVLGLQADPRRAPEPGRVAAVRIVAALIVGPVLVCWGVVVGTVVGWQVSRELLGVETHAFFYMFSEMLWVRDIVGLLVKAIAFAAFAAAFACHEGLRGPARPDPDSVPVAACRATCLAAAAMLALNSGWFLLFYHGGPMFGPTLLAPPAP